MNARSGASRFETVIHVKWDRQVRARAVDRVCIGAGVQIPGRRPERLSPGMRLQGSRRGRKVPRKRSSSRKADTKTGERLLGGVDDAAVLEMGGADPVGREGVWRPLSQGSRSNCLPRRFGRPEREYFRGSRSCRKCGREDDALERDSADESGLDEDSPGFSRGGDDRVQDGIILALLARSAINRKQCSERFRDSRLTRQNLQDSPIMWLTLQGHWGGNDGVGDAAR